MSIIRLRIPRKIKKKIKRKSNYYKVFKIICYKDTFTKRIFFDIFFNTSIEQINKLNEQM